MRIVDTKRPLGTPKSMKFAGIVVFSKKSRCFPFVWDCFQFFEVFCTDPGKSRSPALLVCIVPLPAWASRPQSLFEFCWPPWTPAPTVYFGRYQKWGEKLSRSDPPWEVQKMGVIRLFQEPHHPCVLQLAVCLTRCFIAFCRVFYSVFYRVFYCVL